MLTHAVTLMSIDNRNSHQKITQNRGEFKMALGKKKQGHDVVITAASKLYDDSVKMFTEAEVKIDEANSKLDATIQELDAAIVGLEKLRLQALADKERNESFKSKLKEFTAQ
jgi:hypothetical protein